MDKTEKGVSLPCFRRLGNGSSVAVCEGGFESFLRLIPRF
jgi:hypothetical protein